VAGDLYFRTEIFYEMPCWKHSF